MAPRKIPSAKYLPPSNKTAKAKPDAGQIGEAFEAKREYWRLAVANTKYTAATRDILKIFSPGFN